MIKIERIKYYVFAVFDSIRFEKHKHVQHVTFFYKPVIVPENLAKLIFAKLSNSFFRQILHLQFIEVAVFVKYIWIAYNFLINQVNALDFLAEAKKSKGWFSGYCRRALERNRNILLPFSSLAQRELFLQRVHSERNASLL